MKFTKIYLHCEQENKDSTQGYIPTHICTCTHHTHAYAHPHPFTRTRARTLRLYRMQVKKDIVCKMCIMLSIKCEFPFPRG